MARELTPIISGVYLLYGRRATATGRVFYVGESSNVAVHFVAHVHRGGWIRQPRLILLFENGDERQPLQQEARFIGAAVKMGLPLANNSGINKAEENWGKEIAVLEEALNLLDLVQTSNKRIVAIKPAARTLPLFPRKKEVNMERVNQIGAPDYDGLTWPTQRAGQPGTIRDARRRKMIEQLLHELEGQRFHGSLEVKFEAGKVTLIRKTETINPRA